MAKARGEHSLPKCHGHRPWLGAYVGDPHVAEECGIDQRLLVRTASGGYSSQVESALTIPANNTPSEVREFLVRHDKRDLANIGSVADLYVRDPGIAFRTDTGEEATEQDAKTEAWGEGLRGAVASLTNAGIAVAVVHPVPHFLDWDPRTCAPARLRRGDCGRSVDLAQADTDRGGVVAAEVAAVRDAAGAPAMTVDLVPELCRDGRCTTNDGSRWRFRDGVHLTVGASAALSPTFTALLDDVLASSARP